MIDNVNSDIDHGLLTSPLCQSGFDQRRTPTRGDNCISLSVCLASICILMDAYL